MAPAKKKDPNHNAKRTCSCGCGQLVSAQTERNYLKGKARPLVKAHHAARRLAVLGLSPARLKEHILQSPVLSPLSPSQRRRRKQGKGKKSVPAVQHMELDADEPVRDDEDMLPVSHPPDGADDPLSGTLPGNPGLEEDSDAVGSPMRVDNDLYDPDAVGTLRDATAAARAGVWSNGHRVTIEEEPEDDADADMYMDADLEEEEDSWGPLEEDYDEYEWLYGLPAGDIIDEEMERQLAEFAEELLDDDMAILRTFALKTEDHLTNATFEKLPLYLPRRLHSNNQSHEGSDAVPHCI
ncbi:hypothetical protein MVEN_01137100 [Mycena venus]|uniref:Uncharacterized protein n=1 Tax=Mycena venus TaxID=2733690 RepID=A0A8H6Y8Q6_9AGAR|nr:hypothetical protein MVEN_01137100 [Mycena venus]